MVMALVSMAPVSKPPTAATFAIVTMDGMVQSAMFQVAPVTLRLVPVVLKLLVEILECILDEACIQAECLLDMPLVRPLMYPMVFTYWETAVSASLNSYGQCSQVAMREVSSLHAGCDGHGPCIHGTCEQAANGSYICNCDDGWYGPECDVPGSATYFETCPCCARMVSKCSEKSISWKLAPRQVPC